MTIGTSGSKPFPASRSVAAVHGHRGARHPTAFRDVPAQGHGMVTAAAEMLPGRKPPGHVRDHPKGPIGM